MYNKEKWLSQNILIECDYIGMDTGILNRSIFYENYNIDEGIVGQNKIEQEKDFKVYKLSNIFNYLLALANSGHNKYQKCLDLFTKTGIPFQFCFDENNEYIDLKDIYIFEDQIDEIEENLRLIKNLFYNKPFDSNVLSRIPPVSFTIQKSKNLINNYTLVVSSNNIFSLAIYYYSKMKPFSLDKHYICSECGNVYRRESNKIKYCDACKNKIDFPKVSHSKNKK